MTRDQQSFESYWERLCSNNPKLSHDDNRLTLTVAEFKKQLSRLFVPVQAAPQPAAFHSGAESFIRTMEGLDVDSLTR